MRGLGGAQAALLAALAVAFARLVTSESSGDRSAAAAPWLALTLAVGAPLAVFTGFPKTAADLCVLTLALAFLGVRLVRDGRGHLPFGLTLAVALLDHRAALVFLPAAGYAVWRCLARRDGQAASPWRWRRRWSPWRSWRRASGASSGPTTCPWTPPRRGDPGARHRGKPDPRDRERIADDGAARRAPAAPVPLPRRARGRADIRYLLLLATAFVPVVLFVHPRQGLLRDWEVLTPAAVAFTALVVWTLGTLVATRQAAPRLAVAAAFATFVPALALLLHAHRWTRGWRGRRRCSPGRRGAPSPSAPSSWTSSARAA